MNRLILAPVLAALLVLPATQASAQDIQYRIIGGDAASIADYPSLAPILVTQLADQRSQYQRQYCAGNFITQRWVLTAAHCMFDGDFNQASPSDISLLANVTDLAVGGEELAVANIHVHPDYTAGMVDSTSDLALIELAQDADVTPMSLYIGEVPSGTSAWLAGWGATEYNEITFEASDYPTELMDVQVPVVGIDDCNVAFESSGVVVDSTQLCAGLEEGGKDSCAGDSGGPMMVSVNGRLAQAGIVSFGAGCAVAGFPGVYTRVGAFADWIQSFTATSQSAGTLGNYVEDGKASGSSGSSGGGLGAFAMLPLLLPFLRRRLQR